MVGGGGDLDLPWSPWAEADRPSLVDIGIRLVALVLLEVGDRHALLSLPLLEGPDGGEGNPFGKDCSSPFGRRSPDLVILGGIRLGSGDWVSLGRGGHGGLSSFWKTVPPSGFCFLFILSELIRLPDEGVEDSGAGWPQSSGV